MITVMTPAIDTSPQLLRADRLRIAESMVRSACDILVAEREEGTGHTTDLACRSLSAVADDVAGMISTIEKAEVVSGNFRPWAAGEVHHGVS